MDFFELLRFSLGEDVKMSSIDKTDWVALHQGAKQHSLLGVVFGGIERLPPNMYPPREILLRWYSESEAIKKQNAYVNNVVVSLSELYAKQGLHVCILKGQGNNLLYPNPYTRTPGDIDVWLVPNSTCTIKDIISWSRKNNENGRALYHHVDAGEYKGVEVEVHYRPSFMNNLIHNRRLQKWFEENAGEQFAHEVELPNGAGRICVPTNAFNRIYQMAHIYNHVIHEGVGLRQLMDYYYLLKKAKDESEKLKVKSEKFFDENSGLKSGNLNAGHVGSEGLELSETLRYLGLETFAGAVMWVLKEKLGLEEQYLIVQPNEKLGRFLLDEIMQGGNFGQYDTRVKHGGSQLSKNIQRLKRDIRLMWYFPSECLWEPVFRVYHFFWRVLVKFRV